MLTRGAPLGRKADAALAAACSKNGTTSTSTHTQAETVHLRAATVIGLERTLAHDKYSLVLTRLIPENLAPMGTPKDKAERPAGQTYISQLKLSTGTLMDSIGPKPPSSVWVREPVQEKREV